MFVTIQTFLLLIFSWAVVGKVDQDTQISIASQKDVTVSVKMGDKVIAQTAEQICLKDESCWSGASSSSSQRQQIGKPMHYNNEKVVTEVVSDKYVFFVKDESPFSQWHPVGFNFDSLNFGFAEQWMMKNKADLFEGNSEVGDKIMDETNPDNIKKLGRQVKGFTDDIWKPAAFNIILHGTYLKFTQNKKLNDYLLNTPDFNGKTFVEAAYYDKVWGVALSYPEHTLDVTLLNDISYWEGENCLGFAITLVRDYLLEQKTKLGGKHRDPSTVVNYNEEFQKLDEYAKNNNRYQVHF